MKGIEIREIRKKLGKTQLEFANMLKVSQNSVQSWETGKRNPTHSTVLMIENIYNEYMNGESDKSIKSVFIEKQGVKISIEEISDFIIKNKVHLESNLNYAMYLEARDLRVENKAFKDYVESDRLKLTNEIKKLQGLISDLNKKLIV